MIRENWPGGLLCEAQALFYIMQISQIDAGFLKALLNLRKAV